MSSCIKKVINGHAARRIEIGWVSGLRGEVPHMKGTKQGLGQLILSRNHFSDQFARDLLPVLGYDQFLRSVDLSANEIKEDGIQDLLGWLETSRNVINLDLRENPGYNASTHKRVIQTLARNIKKLKGDRASLKRMLRKKWISEELLSCYTNGDECEPSPETVPKKTPKKKSKKKDLKNVQAQKGIEKVVLVKADTDRPSNPHEKPQQQPGSGKKQSKHIQMPPVNEDCRGISYSDDLIPKEGNRV